MNIVSLFLDAAKAYPDKLAIIDKKGEITFSQLEKEVRETASYFQSKGIKKGDRVLVFVPMSNDLYRIVLALFYIGATAVFLDEWVSKSRMELCCKIADCKGFIGVFKARVFALFSRELRRIPIKLKMNKRGIRFSEYEIVENDTTALITFTTGSTGRPKAANRTHNFLKEQFNALIDEIEPSPNDIDMPALPIVLFMNLGVGCTSVIPDFSMSKPERMKPGEILNQIIKQKVNRIISSPYFVAKLSNYILEKEIKIDAIHKIFTGGAPVFKSQASVFKNAFPNTKISIVYGSTEAEPISTISASDLINYKEDDFGLPVGQLYHRTKLKIIKLSDANFDVQTADSFESLQLNDGEIGEIVVSGPHVLKEYFNSPDAFRQNKIVVENTIWHRTGDSGRMINNQLFLTGRCNQLINYKGILISPFNVEGKLLEIQGIITGTIILKNEKLVLVLETDLNSSELEGKLNEIQHDKLIVLKEIPRDPRHHSKIDYAKLLLLLDR